MANRIIGAVLALLYLVSLWAGTSPSTVLAGLVTVCIWLGTSLAFWGFIRALRISERMRNWFWSGFLVVVCTAAMLFVWKPSTTFGTIGVVLLLPALFIGVGLLSLAVGAITDRLPWWPPFTDEQLPWWIRLDPEDVDSHEREVRRIKLVFIIAVALYFAWSIYSLETASATGLLLQ